MGEKEIKPADDKPKPGPLDPGGDLTTREKPGTGNPNAKQGEPDPKPSGQKGGDAGGGGSWSGSSTYPDGFTMGRDSSGTWTLDHPDGSSATWDPGSQTWTGADGKARGADWSGGHTPATQTDFGPKR